MDTELRILFNSIDSAIRMETHHMRDAIIHHNQESLDKENKTLDDTARKLTILTVNSIIFELRKNCGCTENLHTANEWDERIRILTINE